MDRERFYNPELTATRPIQALLMSGDHSGSVFGYMKDIISAYENVLNMVETEEILKDAVQLTLTAFNEEVDVLKYPDEENVMNDKIRGLKANGGTSLHYAIEKNAQYLLHSIKEQQKMGRVFNGAMMIVPTDGEPTDAPSASFDQTMEYLKSKGIKLLAFALPGADEKFLNKYFDLVVPIGDIHKFPHIVASVCQAILPSISQSRPGESLTFKFGTNEGVKDLVVDVDEIVIDDDNPVIDVRG